MRDRNVKGPDAPDDPDEKNPGPQPEPQEPERTSDEPVTEPGQQNPPGAR